MTLALTLVAVALAVLLLLLYLEGGRRFSLGQMEELEGRIHPVDLDAFRNLTDPQEEDYLRANLRPGQFRSIQRERCRSALDYIRNSAHNAAFLMRMGEAATRSEDPRVAHAGRQLVDAALRLRAYAMLSSLQLYARMAVPGARLSYGKLADNYQHLSGLATQLAHMQHPAGGTRFSALL